MQEYEKKAAAKREQLANSIPEAWRIPASALPPKESLNVTDFPRTSGLLTSRELEITETNLVPLAQKIADGTWTAKEVTLAFCHRAAIAHQLVNCCVEIFFDVAIASAELLDESLKTNGTVVGPLHGVPVSLKDQFRVTGIETSMGYVAWLGKKETRDSILTDLLRKSGAVLYCKTNVPQTLMLGETFNNIIGRTVNPYNRGLSCGGSSGGEGALLGLRGSVIGLGTDIGGSIRIPAAFNHLFGLRPSHGRLPYGLMANSMEGQETLHSVVGPLGQSVQDLTYFTKSIIDLQPWYHDPKVVELPWREDKVTQGAIGPKTFAYLEFDGLHYVHKVIDSFRGHTYDHQRCSKLIGRVFSADGGEDLRKVIEEGGEPPIPSILLADSSSALSANQSWDLQTDRYNYQREYMEHWNEQNREHGTIDGIVMPVAPHAAVMHDSYMYYGYTNIVNLLDYSSVVVPVGFANAALDPVEADYQPISALDKAVWENYDPAKYDGAPTAIQVVGRRFQEEYVLGLAQQVDAALQQSSQSTSSVL